MKTVCLLIFFSSPFTTLFSQSIGGVELEDVDTEYIQMSTGGIGRKGIQVYIDFGQENQPFNTKDFLLVDGNGKIMNFNSPIKALNFLAKYNYELEEIYVIPSETSGNAYFVLKRKQNISGSNE